MIGFCYSNERRSPKRWFLTLTRLNAREDFSTFAVKASNFTQRTSGIVNTVKLVKQAYITHFLQ
jgi:hypothetical protein